MFSSNFDGNSYIDRLIDQIFSILPTYEESGYCKELSNKIDNILYRLNGFFEMNSFNSDSVTDILSFINALKHTDDHKRIRSCVLKSCTLLSDLKAVGKS